MTIKEKKTGRTFYDFISENPKLSITIFLFILIAIITIVWIIIKTGANIKVGNIEVGKNKIDTIIKIKDEIKDTENSLNKTLPIIKSEQHDNINKIVANSDDTIISVKNQPANINTGINNGIIGNNNDVKINVSKVQRNLNETMKKSILKNINKVFESYKNIDSCVIVYSLKGNLESLNYAKQILLFLQQQKLNVRNGIVTYDDTEIIKGVGITYGFVPIEEFAYGKDLKRNCACVVVGD